MLEELAVLDRGDGVYQRFGQVFVLDYLTFFALLVYHRRDQLRLDLRLAQLLLAVQIDDLLNAFAVSPEGNAEIRKGFFAVDFGVVARMNVYRVIARAGIVPAIVVVVRYGGALLLLVADFLQVVEHVDHPGSRPVANGERRGVNPRRPHENVAA